MLLTKMSTLKYQHKKTWFGLDMNVTYNFGVKQKHFDCNVILINLLVRKYVYISEG